jgi:hypothetical protein
MSHEIEPSSSCYQPSFLIGNQWIPKFCTLPKKNLPPSLRHWGGDFPHNFHKRLTKHRRNPNPSIVQKGSRRRSSSRSSVTATKICSAGLIPNPQKSVLANPKKKKKKKTELRLLQHTSWLLLLLPCIIMSWKS